MGIDLQKMQKKLDRLQNPKGEQEGDSKNFKPQDGEQVIRVLPSKDGDPFKQFFLHYNMRGIKGGFLCPRRNFDEDCPVCDLAFRMWKQASETNDEDAKQTAKDLFPRERYFSAIIVRGKEKEGVKVWGYGKTSYEKLIKTVLDPDYGDITDVNTGTDLKMTYGKKPGKKYPDTDLDPRRKTSPLAEGDETFGMTVKELLETVPDLSSTFERKTTEEVREILDTHLSAPDEEETNNSIPANENGTEKFGAGEAEGKDAVGKKITDLLEEK